MPWVDRVAIFLYNLLAGVDQVFVKILSRSISPIFLVAIRMALGGMIMSCVCGTCKNSSGSKIDKSLVPYLIRGVLFRIFLPNILLFWAIQYMTVVKSSLFFNLSPFISYLLSYLLLHDQMTRRKTIGLIIGLSSGVPLLLTSTNTTTRLQDYCYLSLPELAYILGITLLCYGWIDMKKLITINKNISVAMVTGFDMFFGGILALSVSWATGQIDLQAAYSLNHSTLLVLSVFLHISGTRILYPWLLRYYSQTFMALASRLMPIIIAIVGWLCLGEGVDWNFPFSMVLTLLGLKIYHTEEFRYKYKLIE